MDPCLEPHWPDVHASLVFLGKAAIQRQLSDDLGARGEERLIVEDASGRVRWQHPDVRVVEHGDSADPLRPLGNIAVAEPLILEIDDEPLRQGNIEIIDASSGGRVVTVVEFLSPTNKLPGDGRAKYRRKQDECVAGGVNLVEIDLTRQGERARLVSQTDLPPEYRTLYLTCVYRATWEPHGRKEVYRIPLRERLPAIRVPLRGRDADIVLDLQELLNQAYLHGRYDRTTNYTQPCHLPLDPADAAWARELLHDLPH